MTVKSSTRATDTVMNKKNKKLKAEEEEDEEEKRAQTKQQCCLCLSLHRKEVRKP